MRVKMALNFLAATRLWVLAAIFAPNLALAELGQPNGPVLLTVSGDIAVTNAEGEAHFDLDMLKAIGGKSFATTTIWTEGEQVFTGVALSDLLATLGVDNGTLKATAINDYSIEIPAVDAAGDGPIVAYERNGEQMPVRDKGPLWIVYPFDTNPDYQAEVYYARSIWQLNRIEVQR